MPIISIACSKGGVGKSTIATSLSVSLQKRGYSVALLDCDSQRTADEWGDFRDEDLRLDNINHIQKLGKISTTVKRLSQDYSFIVIDTAGHDSSSEMRLAVSLSDLVVVPLKASQADLGPVSDMADLIEEISIHNDKLKSIYVINMANPSPRSKKVNVVQSAFSKDSDIKLFKGLLHNRDSYVQAISEGMGVIELKDKKAINEFEAFTDFVLKNLSIKKLGIRKSGPKKKKTKKSA